MKAHRSLTRLDVYRYSTDKIALMVASEFLRASDRSAYPSIVSNCFHRARELMGILETKDIPSPIAILIKPVYNRCEQNLLFSLVNNPQKVSDLSSELAKTFDSLSESLTYA